MRYAAAHSEVQSSGGQHDVVGPGRHCRNNGENDERGKELEFDSRLRFKRFWWLITDADFRGQPTESKGASKTLRSRKNDFMTTVGMALERGEPVRVTAGERFACLDDCFPACFVEDPRYYVQSR
jgi:hypothetical protein